MAHILLGKPVPYAVFWFADALGFSDAETVRRLALGLVYVSLHTTIKDDFAKSLYFLDGTLASDIIDAYKKSDVIKSFLTDPSKPELDIEVKNVALEGMQNPPYKARVDFHMVYYSPADHSELKRTLYTANFVFLFKTNVPNELIPINPLGLAITYFREDEAFR